MKFHVLPDSVREVPSPDSFTYPFSYEPHPLSIAAASEVRSYVESQSQWSEELSQGKMLGVLVVEKKGERGFLAAFSGTLGGKTLQEYFVPPVFDLMCPRCYFQEEQERISELNRRINGLEVQMQPSPLHLVAEQEIEEARKKMTEAKFRRHQLRITLSAEELEEKEPEMIRESQFLKAQLKRIESSWKKRLEEADHPLLVLQAEVKRLQAERQQRSQDLQQWLFSQYVFLNASAKHWLRFFLLVRFQVGQGIAAPQNSCRRLIWKGCALFVWLSFGWVPRPRTRFGWKETIILPAAVNVVPS